MYRDVQRCLSFGLKLGLKFLSTTDQCQTKPKEGILTKNQYCSSPSGYRLPN